LGGLAEWGPELGVQIGGPNWGVQIGAQIGARIGGIVNWGCEIGGFGAQIGGFGVQIGGFGVYLGYIVGNRGYCELRVYMGVFENRGISVYFEASWEGVF